MRKSILGLDENIVSAAAYFGVWVTGILVLIFERDNKTVRFHALQSVVFFLPVTILSFLVNVLVSWIPFIGPMINFAFYLITIVAWVYLMYAAIQGRQFKIPVIGEVVEAQLNRTK